MTKSEFRTKYKNIRNSIHSDAADIKSNMIYNNLIKLKILDNCNCVFTYLSYGREVITDSIINYLDSHNKIILIPKCDIITETMQPVVYTKTENFIKNVYGIREICSSEEYTDTIDIAIVPGICFDIYGNRIGYGKGYYDKFFENHDILKIGLCYSDCLSKEPIPCSINDIKMDYVITDREVLKFKC